MIFSRMFAGVDQSMLRSTRKPRLNHDENRWTKSASTTEVVAVRHRIEQVFAHANERRSAAGRQIEAAEQFLSARLRSMVQLRQRRRRSGWPATPQWRFSMRSPSGPKRWASASKKATRGPVVRVA